MEDVIVIGNKKYKLVPVEERSVLEDYEPKTVESKNEVTEAIPTVSDYRERYKKRQIRLNEIMVQPRLPELKKTDSNLDGYEYKGDSLFFGEGLTHDI